MRKPGWRLIVGATVLLAGCSPGSQTPASPSQPSTLTLTTTSLPAGTVGSAYSSQVAASGGATPYTYNAASLPSALSINSATGAITGTPAQSSVGTASVTIKVTDSTQPSPQSAASNVSLKISPATLAVTTTSLPAGAATSPYPSTTLQATGGVSPYTWALASGSSLPTGLNLSAGGVLSGTPAAAGPYSLTFVVTDSSTPPDTAQATLTLTISGIPVNSSPGPSCGNMSTGNGASLNGYVPFPASNAWNTNIASTAVDPNSAAIITALTGSNLHPDFSNVVDGNYGIPYVVVDSSATPGVPVTMTTYASESDITLYPIPITAPVEGFPPVCTTTGDNHLIVIDKTQCWIYETWQTQLCNGAWSAANGAIWDLTSTEHRPYGWTSADAAGLPIFPGLVRYDEVAAGAINHAIRMTVAQTKSDANGGLFVAPATHAAGNSSTTNNIMGMRLRLKASFDITGFSAANQVILKAMQNYGLIVADNGSNMFFQGAPDARWDDNDLDALKAIDASSFDVVQMGTQYDDATAPTGAAPTISSFTGSQTTVTTGTR
jgi:Putative Ig domain